MKSYHRKRLKKSVKQLIHDIVIASIGGVAIVLYGMIGDASKALMDNYDEVAAAPYANGEVLFMGGTLDSACSFENIEQNMALYENSTMVLISGARHGYGMTPDRASDISIQAVVDFLERTA
jgi:hypothetical protein